MNPERWKKIEDVFQAALDLSGAKREEFVRAECGDDAELRREVEKLIARYETEESFLESPVWTDSILLQPSLKQQIAVSLEDEIPPTRREQENFLGRQIGAFRLTEELGKGGMGVVYLAERADGEFRQQVAIKLIKRGMDTDFIVKRFRHERQIAATLNHPNIARLLDGGTTNDDLPYFVMEFVDGNPFFKYSETKRLNLRQKLELFLQVCRAISYAHGKQIIHRDIKPGNILVTDDGEPKLLDFGIAKILDPDLIHESVMPTATQMRLMTPEYASPEQVRGDEITPASDQYSLGVLLYEMLTGARPYKFPSRSPHDIARIICEEIPSEPSSGEFGKMLSGDLILDKDFCRKLDRIVLKALRKNPLERYESVREFAADIERFLRNEPIHAESFAGEKNSFSALRKSLDLSAATSNQKSIAVLPFKILNTLAETDTGDDGIEFLGIGLADAMITRLSNVRQFLVRPTSSILRYGERTADSFTAGAELNVQFVLDGSIIKTDSRIRVSIQLLNVAEQTTVWAERFDENLTDVLALEDSISKRVVESLVPQLSIGEQRDLAKRQTNNAEAYEAFLRGRFHWNTYTEEGFRQAIIFYQKAIELDPNYAQAHAAIADYYNWLGMMNILPANEFYPPAKRAALRAVELDEKSSEAHSALGLTRLYGEYDWRASEREMLRAIELNPNNSIAHLWYSHNLSTQRRVGEALKYVARAIELDPFSLQNHNTQAWALYFARRFDEAVAKADEIGEKFPVSGYAYFARSCFLCVVGRTEEALRASEKMLELSVDNLFIYGRAQALAAAGKRSEALQLIEPTETRYISNYHTAIIYCYLKETESAFDYLERSLAAHEGMLIWANIEPSLDLLREDSRFAAMLKKINRALVEPAGKNRAEEKTLVKDYKAKSESLPTNQKSIAVLPFKTLNEVSGEDTGGIRFLGVGLADAMITRLSSIRQFVVRPTSSVLRYGASETDSFAAGEELGVQFVLDGNIIKTKTRIRVSVQLLNVRERSIVWAERFDEEFTDVLELEDAISMRVAESIVPQMTTGELQNLAKRGTDDAKAYEAYLRGRYHWNTFTETSFAQAFAAYQEAISHDPDYALAHAGIADYYIWLGIFGVLPPKETYHPAIQAATRAIEIDDKLPEAHAALGFARLCGNYDWKQGERDIRRALFLSPNYAVAHNWLAILLYTAARFDEGIEHARRSVEIDPLTYQNYRTLSWGFYFSRRFAEALAEIDRTIEKFPMFGVAHANRSWALRAVGRTAEAAESSQKAVAVSGGATFVLFGHAQSLAANNQREEALEIIQSIETNEKVRYVSRYQVALVYCYLNETGKALDALEAALADGEGWLVWLAVEPALDALRGEARFGEITRRVNARTQMKSISEANLISSGGFASNKYFTGEMLPTAEQVGKSRRAGIKQGAFLIIVSFLLLPVFIVLVASVEFLTPAHLILLFFLLLGGGLIRILYAFFFEPKHAASSPNINVLTSSHPSLAAPTEENPAGKSDRFFTKRVKYWLAATVLLSSMVLAYHFFTHSTFDFSSTPPSERWQNNFAATMTLKRLTMTGKARQAMLSYDGANVVYTLEEAAQQSLWLRPVNSENARQLVAPGNVFYSELSFAPDGQSVYYRIRRSNERILYRISIQGGAPQKISENVYNLFAISPDGRRIVYDHQNPDNKQHSLFVAELDENSQIKSAETLFVLDLPNYFPGGISFAPDGKKFVYPRSVIEKNKEVINLFVYDLETKTNERLGSADFDRINSTAWRINGEEIVISASENNSAPHQLWLVNYPSGEVSRLTNDFTNYLGVSLTADSMVLATTKIDEASNIWTAELSESKQNYESKSRQITSAFDRQDGINGVSWTNDGRILHTAAAGAERGIALMNADGSNSRSIATGAVNPSFPSLTSDNRYLIYADKKGQELNIWRFDMIEGALEQISSRYAVTPTIAPDNRLVVYSTLPNNSSNKLAIHRKSIDSGEETPLTNATSVRPVVSPDNQSVACNYAGEETNNIWQIAVLPLYGNAATRFIKPYINNFFRSPQERPLAWSPDGRFLYFLNHANNVSNIFRVAVAGDASPLQMTHFTSGEIFDFALASDGKTLVLARGSTSSDVVIFRSIK